MPQLNTIQRVNSDYLNSILGHKFNVLDKGFIRVIDYMGDESSIVQAARVSYGSGTKTVNEDKGLIRYLMRNKHTTPLEMCELKIHVKLPIFIARQWIRHRTASVNEYSARYSVLDKEFYIPNEEDLQKQSTANKQGREGVMDAALCKQVQDLLVNDANSSYDTYEELLNSDLSRELARMNLSLNYYTQWYWKIDLHNLLHFTALRMHPHAQKEINDYARIISDIVKGWLPNVHKAFLDYNVNSVSFSDVEMQFLKYIFTNNDVLEELKDYTQSKILEGKMSKREAKQFINSLTVGGL